MPRTRTFVALATAAAVLVPAAPALGASYPPPGNPGKIVKPRGKAKTLRVCKDRRKIRRKQCYKSIQAAVDAARPRDTIRVAPGTYRESVFVATKNKSGIKLIGDSRNPRRVVLEQKGLRGSFKRFGLDNVRGQNAIQVNGADNVTMDGFSAYHYKANGFFVVNVTGYTMTHLVAGYGGAYGVYAFNSKGGTMSSSEAFYNNDSGFYIGQTPPQSGRKLRSTIRKVKAWGNVLGFSGTNVKYTTITDSDWYNNGLGIVPNALTSEKYYPPSDNVITNNRVFWNNFNYFKGAPFKLRPSATGSVPYPVGTGILLFGSRDTQVVNNQVYGNYLIGIGGVQQVLMTGVTATDFPNAAERARVIDASYLRRNTISGNRFGNNGANPNGRADLFYDGDGTGNCFSGNTAPGSQLTTVPANGSTFTPCPFGGTNAFDQAAQGDALTWTVGAPNHDEFWVRKPQQAIRGIKPLEICTKTRTGCAGQPR